MGRLCGHSLRTVFIVLLILPLRAGQATDKPRFDKYHVVPYGSYGPGTLTTGQFASVLGWHLTPERWCDAPHATEPPYPLTLCGVQVLVGGHAAGLMYADAVGNRVLGTDQINFQVPANIEAEGEVPIQVCVAGTCSEAVSVPFTNNDILLRVEGKAQVHMPLWADFTIPLNDSFGYPAGPCPWDFDGFQIEVRKDGQILPSRPMPKCITASPPGGPSAIRLHPGGAHRLPVHFFHIFDNPGEYEVRMSGPLLTPDRTKVSRTGHSEWVHITVEPFSDTERQAWLDAATKAVPSGSTLRYERELIVALLAQPDEKALKVLLNFLPSPPPPEPAPAAHIINGNLAMNWMRDCLAPAALDAFPDELVKAHISPSRLANLRKIAGYCSWR